MTGVVFVADDYVEPAQTEGGGRARRAAGVARPAGARPSGSSRRLAEYLR